ncbi:MAG TPA: hypothetical protein VMT91_08585, partial [Anaerolineales bacterium]|nr:hypothetical protein [Anaerolineales bacterium]
RKPAQIIMPDLRILNWYAEMGGQRVTLGSDAHRLPEVSLHLDKAIEAIQSVGITQLTQFEHRQGRLIPL